MSMDPRPYDRLAVVLAYPDESYLAAAQEARAALDPRNGEAAQQVAAFTSRVDALDTDELRELFTVTFDLNPVCSLEVGWHLYGDTYDRGEFLVKARRLLRECGVGESTELPDHLAQLLRVIPRLGAAEAREFAADAVLPAVAKMQAALVAKHNPFEHVLGAVYCLVTADAGATDGQDASAPGRLVPKIERTT